MPQIDNNNRKPDELVMYLIFNKDLKMSKGKIAAQAGHAVAGVLNMFLLNMFTKMTKEDKYWEWVQGSQTKIALRADLEQITNICDQATKFNLFNYLVKDEGRTEVEPGSFTVLGLQPIEKNSHFRKFFLSNLELL